MEARSRRQFFQGSERRSSALSSDYGQEDVSRGATRNEIILDEPADRMTNRRPADNEFLYADDVELDFREPSKRDKDNSFKHSQQRKTKQSHTMNNRATNGTNRMLAHEDPRKERVKAMNSLTHSYIRPETERGDLTNNSRGIKESELVDDTEFGRSIRSDARRPEPLAGTIKGTMTGERQITEKEIRQYEMSDHSQRRSRFDNSQISAKATRQNRFDMQNHSRSEIKSGRYSKSPQQHPAAVEKQINKSKTSARRTNYANNNVPTATFSGGDGFAQKAIEQEEYMSQKPDMEIQYSQETARKPFAALTERQSRLSFMPDDNISQQPSPRKQRSLASYGFCFAFVAILLLIIVIGIFGFLLIQNGNSQGDIVYINNSPNPIDNSGTVNNVDTSASNPINSGSTSNTTDSGSTANDTQPVDNSTQPVAPAGQFKGQIEFGKPQGEYWGVWPDEEELVALNMTDPGWRIKKVMYKANQDKFSLSLIQFVYVNGAVGPACYANETQEADTLVSADVDYSREITGVQARIYEKDGKVEGLRFLDATGQPVFEQTWYKFGFPEPWGEVVPIPEGTKIVGYKCETEGYEINRLSFQLY